MKNNIYIITIILFLLGCEKSPKSPGKPVLVFPENNQVCTSGTVISVTESSINFRWNKSENTDVYELNVKDLKTNAVATYTVNTNQLVVPLRRDASFSWYVVSKSSEVSETVQSDIWKFYNEGVGLVSHPPFPAEDLKPSYNQNVVASGGVVNLSWKGSDPDSDIARYEIYLGITENPSKLANGSTTNMFLNNVPVSSGAIYYWKVVSVDLIGNSSETAVFRFKVN